MLPLTTDSTSSASRITDVTGGVLVRGQGTVSGISTDSRTLVPGDLFVAIVGADNDGHDHVGDAVRAGAGGLLVERVPEDSEGAPFVVVVECARQGLLDLAAAHRRELVADVVAITGSCGKTSTKEIAAHLLAPSRAVVAAERSFNNEIGVPLTLFRAGPRTEICVLELGTNAPGEIARLAAVAAPNVALITVIGRAHLAGLRSVAGVLEEKAALLDALAEDGIAVLNADEPNFTALRARVRDKRILTFAVNREADLTAEGLRPLDAGVALHVVSRASGARVPVELPRLGLHNVRNLLGALAIGTALGEDLEAMLARVPTLGPTPRRLEPKRSPGGVRVLDDSYNANPDSLLAALSVLDTQTAARRKVLVLGDMLELGDDAAAMHRDCGAQLTGRVDALFTVGTLAAEAAAAFREAGGVAHSFADVGELLPELRAMFGDGDLVLFKASRAVALDRAVDALVGAS